MKSLVFLEEGIIIALQHVHELWGKEGLKNVVVTRANGTNVVPNGWKFWEDEVQRNLILQSRKMH